VSIHAIGGAERIEVEPLDRLQHTPRQAIGWPPLPQALRQQQLLLPIDTLASSVEKVRYELNHDQVCAPRGRRLSHRPAQCRSGPACAQ
jgi:hypothetical protein